VLEAAVVRALADELQATQAAREIALAACRRAIRRSSSAVRAVHTGDRQRWQEMLDEAGAALREAQTALRLHPGVAYAGFLQDAEKEYGEAVLTRALVDGSPLPSWTDLAIGLGPWLNGLCEAASELRRQVLDRSRAGDAETAQRLLTAMDAVYEILMDVDYPDAITGGLRRNTDALRAVLERTRSDLVTFIVALRIQDALRQSSPAAVAE
jgi:translin